MSGAFIPDELEKLVLSIPISFAFSVIIIANSSSVPAMPSARAIQASLPDETIIPLNKFSTDILFLTTGLGEGPVYRINPNGPQDIEVQDGNIDDMINLDGDGSENTNLFNEKITNFSFTKSEFNLSLFSTNTILVTKTQEHTTQELFDCIITLTNKSINDKNKIKERVRNCEIKNLTNITAELYKRLVIPLYLPALMLIALLLIIHSKEKINYSRYRLIVFLLGFFLIVFSFCQEQALCQNLFYFYLVLELCQLKTTGNLEV